ncbi:MAG: hypothetical protein WD894_10770 [Pirellulales bacterium]
MLLTPRLNWSDNPAAHLLGPAFVLGRKRFALRNFCASSLACCVLRRTSGEGAIDLIWTTRGVNAIGIPSHQRRRM